ncbi:unnamed protein product [Effrenium voratum]|nr:unnamed protein product [Effrenium voratum]
MMLAAEQPTAEEIDAFVIVNRKFLSDEAEETFRNMDGLDQKHVIAEGSLSNCKDPVAIIKSRARGGFLKAHIDWMHSHRDSSHEDVLDSYIEANVDWMTEEAEELLRSLSFNHLWKVIDFGSLQNCRDPAAIIRIRLKDVLRGKAGKSGKGKSSTGKGVQGRAVLHQAQTDGMDSLPSEDPAESSKGAQGGKAKGAKGAKGTKGAKDGPKDDIHEKALEEGRSLYCLGLPPLWSAKQIQDFFQHQGEVEGVYLQSMGKGKNTRGASVDFTTAEGARNAAMVCDRLEVYHKEEKFTLGCSIRHKGPAGQKFIFPARGEVDFKQAQAEARSVYLSKIPAHISEQQIREMAEEHGEVEAIHMLPSNGFSLACFITMVSPGEAAFMIRALNDAQAFGTIVSASYPIEKNEKRKKKHPEEEIFQWYVLEIKNFPHWTVTDDIKVTISTFGNAPNRVRIIHYDPDPAQSVAKAYFRYEEDQDVALKALAGYEFTPGYALQVMTRPRTAGTGQALAHPSPQPQPPTFHSLTFGQVGLSTPATVPATVPPRFPRPALQDAQLPAAFPRH